MITRRDGGTRMRRRTWTTGALLVMSVAIGGCSGVPRSSAPEVIRNNPEGAPLPAQISAPPNGAEPRAIVQGFLNANVSSLDDNHAAARQFLTPEARGKWTDTSATVVGDEPVGLFDASTKQVTVTAPKLGTIDKSGIYTPSSSTAPASFNYQLAQVNNQWRIDTLPSQGVIITEQQLESKYELHPLYFFDQSYQHLVADPRYSALTEQNLGAWLLGQLLGGPRPELQQAVGGLPPQFRASSAKVAVGQSGSPTIVDLPGISQIDNDNRRRVAAELATTLSNQQSSTFRITDNKRPVVVSGLPDPFSASDFSQFTGVNNAPVPAFYVGDDGTVRDAAGAPLKGLLNQKNANLTAVALAQDANGGNDYPAAGITGPAGSALQRLRVGTRTTGLRPSGVPAGVLTRPAWAPDLPEVWIGSGHSLWRQQVGGPAEQIDLPANNTASIRSIAFSRDGVRIALVLDTPRGGQVSIGTVGRTGGKTATVDKLVPVTPTGVDVNDVAWNDDTTLYVVGSTPPSGYGVWSVRSDGSAWTERSRQNLPGAATQIAAARDQSPWVCAGGAIFAQRSSTWESPFGSPDTTVRGCSPTYLQ